MEVTTLNFEEVYPKVCKSIENADFLSFDSELTGLGRNGENRHCALDTPEERYKKVRNDVTEYNMIQFGLSTFKIDLTNKSIQTATYCFYLNGEISAAYKYDVSSMDFLIKNDFDFNKLFKNGISFISIKEEEAIRNKPKYVNVLRQHQVKTTDSKNLIVEMTAKLNGMKTEAPDNKLTIPFKGLSSFHRKLIVDNLAYNFPSYLIRNCFVNYHIEITRFETTETKEAYLAKVDEDNLKKKIGFGLVGRKIMEAKKPIVAHNAVLDIFHFMDKIVCSLPPSYAEFKTLVKSKMPAIYDTKLIVRDPPFSTKILNSALINIYSDLKNELSDINIETESGSESYSITGSVSKHHDAGFDAFMTGICFLSLTKELMGGLWMKKGLFSSRSLTTYANRINIMYAHDIPFLDLIHDEIVPDRSNIFVVECPPTWTGTDIKTCFKLLRSHKTVWVNDTKLYVIPVDPASLSLSMVTKDCPDNVHISMYKLPGQTNGGAAVESQCTKHTREESDNNSHSEEKELKRIKNIV